MNLVFHNAEEWTKMNRRFFKPPICNKMMHDEQLKVFYVGGPNIRSDYHLEEGEELFYMVKGDMRLKVYANHTFQDVDIKEGEIFLLPAKIPHSPQRKANTIGLVLERERLENEKDCLRYHVSGSEEVLFECWFHCLDLGTQLEPIIHEFFASEQYRTGKPISGSITTDPPYEVDHDRKLELPINLKQWLSSNRNEIHEIGSKRLYGKDYETCVMIHGAGNHLRYSKYADTFLWQLEGTSVISTKEETMSLRKANDTLLIPKGTRYNIDAADDSILMTVTMDAAQNQSNNGHKF